MQNLRHFIANDIAVSWLQRIFAINNRQRASDRFTIKCSSLTIKQSSVYLISSRSNAAIWTSTACHLIAMESSATFLTSKQPSVHLMTSTSNAALTISLTDNRQRASDRFTIKCSSSDITFNQAGRRDGPSRLDFPSRRNSGRDFHFRFRF